MKLNFSQKGFTLVELLVVIALIGVLASIVSVSLQNPQKQASQAVAKRFYSQIDHALGFYAVGKWSLDEESGDIAQDNSGYSNNGNLAGSGVCPGSTACPTWQAEANCVFGKCLSFDGSNDYVSIPANSLFNFTNTDNFTVSAWFLKSSSGNTAGGIVSRKSWWSTTENWYLHFPTSQRLCWGIGDTNTGSVNNGAKICMALDVAPMEWYHAVGVYDAGKVRFFVNGKMEGVEQSGKTFILDSGLPVVLGHPYATLAGPTLYFPGRIDEVRIYSQALTVAQIEQLYARGLKTHQLAVQP